MNLTDFIEKNLARGYYDDSVSSTDYSYSGALVPLVHGLNMDDKPHIIPVENIEKAKLVIRAWEEQDPHSILLQWEKGWIAFLERDYQKAVSILEAISDRFDETPESKHWFIKSYYYRNLGFCYDMLLERDKAIEAYQKCKIVCEELKLNEFYSKMTYKDYAIYPYKRPF